MPVYEYLCSKNHRTERVKSIKVSDAVRENDTCDECGKHASLTQSRVSPPVLVGRGFHANEYNAPTK